MKEDNRVKCKDCKWFDYGIGTYCKHTENRQKKYDPIEGEYETFVDVDNYKKWNKDGYCRRFEKES